MKGPSQAKRLPPSHRGMGRAVALACLLWAACAQAAGGPEGVLVVVNGDSWASMAVANEFIHLRRIPPSQVVYLRDLPGFESVDVDVFRQQILTPVLETIRERNLSDRIDCIAYSADLPWAVDVQRDVGARKLPKFIIPLASINGMTYLHQMVMAKDPSYLRLDANRYMRRPIKALAVAPLTDEEQKRYDEAMRLCGEKTWGRALPMLNDLAQRHPDSDDIHYNIACCLARQNRPDEAMAALRRAVQIGWMNPRYANSDEDLIPLRARKDFQDLLGEMKNRTFEVQPSHSFRSAYEWNERGEIVPSGGRRYMLSTMLAVTSGRGNSVGEAIECLRRSAAADGRLPTGVIYYMVNNDVRSTTRDWAFPCAVAELKKLDVEGRIVAGVLPKGAPDVQGAMIGIAGFDWKSSGSVILPGAICEHLTSCGAMLREGDSQTPLTEFIRCGAAGASGTVTEPCAIQAKFPFAFLHAHYARGCTLAEAFYQSVHGPYQLLIVGDPLCRPWARIPRVRVSGLGPGAAIKGRVSLRPEADVPASLSIHHYECFADGRRVASCPAPGSLEVDTAALPDGPQELRVVAITAGPIETEGELILPVEIANHGHCLEASAEAETVRWDRPARLRAKLAGAREIAFFHNARPVGTIHGSEGEVEIDPRALGQGHVLLQPAATLADPPNARVVGRAIQLTVVPPPALPGAQPDPKMRFAEGLILIRNSGQKIVVYDTQPADWLRGFAEAGEPIELAGSFDAPGEDVYQFQVNGNFDVALEVDGAPLSLPEGEGWRLAPVALGAGTHTLRVRGTAPDKPRLDIRFGGPGAYRLSSLRFRHPVEPVRH